MAQRKLVLDMVLKSMVLRSASFLIGIATLSRFGTMPKSSRTVPCFLDIEVEINQFQPSHKPPYIAIVLSRSISMQGTSVPERDQPDSPLEFDSVGKSSQTWDTAEIL